MRNKLKQSDLVLCIRFFVSAKFQQVLPRVLILYSKSHTNPYMAPRWQTMEVSIGQLVLCECENQTSEVFCCGQPSAMFDFPQGCQNVLLLVTVPLFFCETRLFQ